MRTNAEDLPPVVTLEAFFQTLEILFYFISDLQTSAGQQKRSRDSTV